ncbi:three-Cys-motif partner protein TcmP [Endozoicomonas sp. ALB032]|uniref:three-Cys-motif partner protein TcmP n=1 Tax=Endozoicomonas sp. ALB032 TaxID=3403082 RepID=UPI003BB52EAC
MAAPSSTCWPLDPHTIGKHQVLKSYMHAWLPILSSGFPKLMFIDGFAGPGEYECGSPGSPIIALDALIQHSYKQHISSQVDFYFLEKDERRISHLSNLVKARYPSLPPNVNVYFINGVFDTSVTELLDQVEIQSSRQLPCFAMIDPFGVTDNSMDTMARLLSNPRAELYISFMYSYINRFKNTSSFENSLDSLFGCPDWREGRNITDQENRKDFFYNLYKQQLKRSGASEVVYFDLYRGNELVYTIFFATKSRLGCDKMKQAIWRAAPDGNMIFRGSEHQDLLGGALQPNFKPLQVALTRQFKGQGWIRIESIQDFVASDRTDYHTGHTKSQALKLMEKNGDIEVDTSTRKRRNTYPNGTRLRFL